MSLLLRKQSGFGRTVAVLALAGLAVAAAGCLVTQETAKNPVPPPEPPPAPVALAEVAHADRQWTGVAATADGRVFVNFPRWSDDVPVSVAELLPTNELRPFPNDEWNRRAPGLDPATHFICVQSVVAEGSKALWVLDPASPQFRGVETGGAKLVKFDIATGTALQTIRFDAAAAPADSYLNDVRIDPRTNTAFITDSGLGAILVVDLASGRARRVLESDPSTKSEGVSVTISGVEWRRADGSQPDVHADGLALDPAGEYLYYQALTGKSLYRVPVKALRNETLTEVDLAKTVECLGVTGVADGMEFGADGMLYLTGVEDGVINRFDPVSRNVAPVVQDPARLLWPDSLAAGPNGALFVTASQIQLGAKPQLPYRLFSFRPPPPPKRVLPLPAP